MTKNSQAHLSLLAQRTPEPAISWLMKLTLENPELLSLAAGFTDNQSLPVLEVTRLTSAILRGRTGARKALQYGTTAGLPELRDITARRLSAMDTKASGLKCAHQAQNTVITSGSQQLLYILSEALFNAGDILLVEDPTYFVFLGIAQSFGIQTRGLKIDSDGINLEDLVRRLKELRASGEIKRLKALYTVSYFQNPSGITLSAEKKKRILELLRSFETSAGHPIYLIEDAAYRELRFAGPDTTSALAYSQDRVLYAGTYSKPFSTGARVGFGILPEPLFTAVARIKGNHDFGTANFLQEIVYLALQSGLYDEHLKILQARYAKKSGMMEKAINQHFPEGIVARKPDGGLYFWAHAPKHIRTDPKSKLFQTALKSGVLYVPGDLCYGEDRSRKVPKNQMRLSFGGARDQDIDEAIRRLGVVLSKFS